MGCSSRLTRGGARIIVIPVANERISRLGLNAACNAPQWRHQRLATLHNPPSAHRSNGLSSVKPQPKPAGPAIVPVSARAVERMRLHFEFPIDSAVRGKANRGVARGQLILGIAKVCRLEWISPQVYKADV
jgi:hypothetical protein